MWGYVLRDFLPLQLPFVTVYHPYWRPPKLQFWWKFFWSPNTSRKLPVVVIGLLTQIENMGKIESIRLWPPKSAWLHQTPLWIYTPALTAERWRDLTDPKRGRYRVDTGAVSSALSTLPRIYTWLLEQPGIEISSSSQHPEFTWNLLICAACGR